MTQGKPLNKDVGGRPTKYKEEYCKLLIDHMSKGYSFKSFGGVVEVCEDTLFEWVKQHKLFSESKKIGTVKSMQVWEKSGMDNLTSPQGITFNSSVWIFNMKNRFGWADKNITINADAGDIKIIEKLMDV